MIVKLGIRSPDGIEAERFVSLADGARTVGRSERADVHLPDMRCSRLHALLEADGHGQARIRDLGSRHGMRVDGAPATASLLRPGLRIELGTTQLRILSVGDSHRTDSPW